MLWNRPGKKWLLVVERWRNGVKGEECDMGCFFSRPFIIVIIFTYLFIYVFIYFCGYVSPDDASELNFASHFVFQRDLDSKLVTVSVNLLYVRVCVGVSGCGTVCLYVYLPLPKWKSS